MLWSNFELNKHWDTLWAVDVNSVDNVVDRSEKGPQRKTSIEDVEIADLFLEGSVRAVVHIRVDINYSWQSWDFIFGSSIYESFRWGEDEWGSFGRWCVCK